MVIRPLDKPDIEAWIGMRHRLWAAYEREDLIRETVDWAQGKLGVFVAEAFDGLVGFAEVTMRERAPGCTTSPVGYLEGWWVDPDYRREGIGSALLAACEQWSRVHGATEFASDAHADNEVSRAAHEAAGFAEKRAVVRFHKQIGDAQATPPEVDRAATITLREINRENVRAVIRLDVAPHQKTMVASNAVSLAQYSVTTKAWTRAIYADDVLVGYVLVSDDHEAADYYLWRLMVDRRYQGMGFGRIAMQLVIDYVRTRPGAKGLSTSYVPVAGGPEGFYKSLGFG